MPYDVGHNYHDNGYAKNVANASGRLRDGRTLWGGPPPLEPSSSQRVPSPSTLAGTDVGGVLAALLAFAGFLVGGVATFLESFNLMMALGGALLGFFLFLMVGSVIAAILRRPVLLLLVAIGGLILFADACDFPLG